MITEDNINIINDERIGSIKSSINELRQDLAVNNLRKDLSKLENNRTSPEDSFLDKIEIINDAPSWLPKADFSRTQTDLIAKNYDGEEVVFVDYFTNYDPPSILTDNGLLLKGTLLKALAGPLAPGQYAQAAGGEQEGDASGAVRETYIHHMNHALNIII